MKKNICFSLMFGGGAKYGSGEDTLFLNDCLNAGLKIYAVTTKIADVKQEESSWFTGFNEKYYFDKGALFAAMGRKKSLVLISVMAIKIKMRKESKFKLNEIIKLMMEGRKSFLEIIY